MDIDPELIEIEDSYIEDDFGTKQEEEQSYDDSEGMPNSVNTNFAGVIPGNPVGFQQRKQTSFDLPSDDPLGFQKTTPDHEDIKWLLQTITDLCHKANEDDLIPKITDELQNRNFLDLPFVPPRVESPFNQAYQHISDIGSGGYGKISKVLNLIDEQYYALKVVRISKDEISSAVREVQCLAALNSPRIVRYFSSWLESKDNEKEALLYIQMQYVPGVTLSDYLFQKKDMDDTERKLILYQITYALSEIHAQNIIHRDFSPNNIIVRDYGKITVIDFGIASIKGKKDYSKQNEHAIASQPRVGSLTLRPIDKLIIKEAGKANRTVKEVGTPLYSSPRQLSGHHSGPSDDVYSLGIIAFEIYSRFTTWMEKTLSIRNLRSSRKIPPEFSAKYPEISSLVESCIFTESKQRPTVLDILNLPLFHGMKDEE
ncbi:AGC family protein kinase [Trichomonas vaginalis G3]|uniref:AGC family protein kinase n=1 Tax=Trichomonas vaginalis (strain ATCC PRA-98 / G3) TaxID=412133 RepID=A2ENI8_TRIV3|nr:eukaryotic translation initiation factor 2alpha kinase protein [Trichomonas vaginalis G3]EAY05766.1 AGC family protein kinase [Trichomonas vaginalis G3]KAI5511411.1 eukaryotic translation initiation factor 2alpha kinase protein [Trichomonas vaginalis G3]|eukprot:XP_001317989.1 AGC family protein kinase [Trichomonas vaginalis G3]